MSKILKLAIGIALTSTIMWSCKNESEPQVKTVEVEEIVVKNEIAVDAKLAKAEFNIEGMTCAIGCAKTIEKKLSEMEGVKSATVNFDKKLAMVEYDEAKVTTTSLEKTITTASDKYSVNGMKTVESFSTDEGKVGAMKKCNHEGKECKKGMEGYKMGDKTSCKEMKKSGCKMMGDKAFIGTSESDMMAHGKDCKMTCCKDKKA